MTELLQLSGSPAERGKRMGQLQRETLNTVIERVQERSVVEALGEGELSDRARELASQINVLVPEWLIEARALAASASVSVSTYLGLNALAWKGPFGCRAGLEESGVAFAVAGQACLTGKAMIHINIDGACLPACTFTRAESPGTLPYAALATVGDLGITAFVNGKGLGGCWQIGPEIDEVGVGIRPSMMLRALAERCLDCRQVLERFVELQRRFGLHTQGGRGISFLFADASGEILQIEAGAIRQANGISPQGLVVCANQFQLPGSAGSERVRDTVRQRVLKDYLMAKPIDLAHVHEGARFGKGDGSGGICSTNTVASFTGIVGTEMQAGYASATLGAPNCVPPVVLFPESGVPAPVADGSVWMVAEDLLGDHSLGERSTRLHDRYAEKWRQLLGSLQQNEWGADFRNAAVQESYEWVLDFVDDCEEMKLSF